MTGNVRRVAWFLTAMVALAAGRSPAAQRSLPGEIPAVAPSRAAAGDAAEASRRIYTNKNYQSTLPGSPTPTRFQSGGSSDIRIEPGTERRKRGTRENSSPDLPGAPTESSASETAAAALWMLWGLLGFLGLFFIYLIIKNWRFFIFTKTNADAPDAPTTTVEIIQNEPPPELPDALTPFEVFARDGRFDLAIHAIFLHSIEYLGASGNITISRSLTGREVAAQLQTAADARTALQSISREVEISKFGGRARTESDYRRCLAQYQQFRAVVRFTGSGAAA